MIEEIVGVQSDGLALEGRYAYCSETAKPAAAVLICPPHPFLGGDMDNNVVTALTRGIAADGLPVLRFNYRGIGASECTRDLHADQAEFWADSACPAYEAEIERDCHAAFAALATLVPRGTALFVLGYSFGCLPALALAQAERVERIGLIAPPLAKWPLASPAFGRRVPLAVFYAPGDFACPEADLDSFYATVPEPRERHCFAAADHFFVGHEADLVAAAVRFLRVPRRP